MIQRAGGSGVCSYQYLQYSENHLWAVWIPAVQLMGGETDPGFQSKARKGLDATLIAAMNVAAMLVASRTRATFQTASIIKVRTSLATSVWRRIKRLVGILITALKPKVTIKQCKP